MFYKHLLLSSEPVDSNGSLSLLVVNIVVVTWLITVQIPNIVPDSSELGVQIKSIRHLLSCNKANGQVTVSPDQ